MLSNRSIRPAPFLHPSSKTSNSCAGSPSSRTPSKKMDGAKHDHDDSRGASGAIQPSDSNAAAAAPMHANANVNANASGNRERGHAPKAVGNRTFVEKLRSGLPPDPSQTLTKTSHRQETRQTQRSDRDGRDRSMTMTSTRPSAAMPAEDSTVTAAVADAMEEAAAAVAAAPVPALKTASHHARVTPNKPTAVLGTANGQASNHVHPPAPHARSRSSSIPRSKSNSKSQQTTHLEPDGEIDKPNESSKKSIVPTESQESITPATASDARETAQVLGDGIPTSRHGDDGSEQPTVVPSFACELNSIFNRLERLWEQDGISSDQVCTPTRSSNSTADASVNGDDKSKGSGNSNSNSNKNDRGNRNDKNSKIRDTLMLVAEAFHQLITIGKEAQLRDDSNRIQMEQFKALCEHQKLELSICRAKEKSNHQVMENLWKSTEVANGHSDDSIRLSKEAMQLRQQIRKLQQQNDTAKEHQEKTHRTVTLLQQQVQHFKGKSRALTKEAVLYQKRQDKLVKFIEEHCALDDDDDDDDKQNGSKRKVAPSSVQIQVSDKSARGYKRKASALQSKVDDMSARLSEKDRELRDLRKQLSRAQSEGRPDAGNRLQDAATNDDESKGDGKSTLHHQSINADLDCGIASAGHGDGDGDENLRRDGTAEIGSTNVGGS